MLEAGAVKVRKPWSSSMATCQSHSANKWGVEGVCMSGSKVGEQSCVSCHPSGPKLLSPCSSPLSPLCSWSHLRSSGGWVQRTWEKKAHQLWSTASPWFLQHGLLMTHFTVPDGGRGSGGDYNWPTQSREQLICHLAFWIFFFLKLTSDLNSWNHCCVLLFTLW